MTSEGTTSKARPGIRGDGKGSRVGLQAQVEHPGLAKGKGTSMDAPSWPSASWFGRSTLPPYIEELRLAKGRWGMVLGKGPLMDALSRPHMILARGTLSVSGRQDQRPESEAETPSRRQGTRGSGVTQEGGGAFAGDQPEWEPASENETAVKRRRLEAQPAPLH